MITLVLGGSASGKSEYAERLLLQARCDESKGAKKYYVATMDASDEESKKRIARHRLMREGKGFITVEQPRFIEEAGAVIEDGSAILIECLSNLLANEMFSAEPDTYGKNSPEGKSSSNTGIPAKEETVVSRIEKGLHILASRNAECIIVSNSVFEDGMGYDTYTTSYIRALGTLNTHIAEFADNVWEVVAGIPVRIK